VFKIKNALQHRYVLSVEQVAAFGRCMQSLPAACKELHYYQDGFCVRCTLEQYQW
jgi:hypothetical protein